MQQPITVTQSGFLKIVKDLNLRFPIAEIVEKTGVDKGTVSKILSKKLEPSDNFLSKFSEAFDLPPMTYTLSPNASGTSHFGNTSEVDRLLAEKDRTIEMLRTDNAWYKAQLEKLMGTNDQQKS